MEHLLVLALIGFVIAAFGSLVGAGGGFIIVPMLMMVYPDFSVTQITAVSMAVISVNSISGSAAYIYNRRVDFKAATVFGLFTIPGAILGVSTTALLVRGTFDAIFGLLLCAIGIYLFLKNRRDKTSPQTPPPNGKYTKTLTDRWGETFTYNLDLRKGALLSTGVGYFSPIFGIGGGILHVPAMIQWLRMPIQVAVPTSQLILAVMSVASVIVHFQNGTYQNDLLQHLILGLAIGAVPGAQFGAYLSHKLKGGFIVKLLASAIVLAGIRIAFSALS